jgi:hypothetical protein
MVRRRVAAGAAVVLLIIIVLVINGCLKSQKQQSLKDYNHSVSEIAREYDSQVGKPLFTALSGASGKSALDVEVQVNQLRMEAEKLTERARGLKTPSEMTDAQRAFLMALGLRVEGISKIANRLPAALGGKAKQESVLIAGDMETFLASDVIYSQRTAPLIQETLSGNGIHESTSATRFLPNLGWLDPTIVEARLTGHGTAGGEAAVAPGTHGSALVGVAVGTNTLEPEPTLNKVSGGSSPTFTVTVENTGSNPESNVKVDVVVTAGGKQLSGSHVINSTQPGSKVNVEIPINGVPLGVAGKIEVTVEAVPGETNTENNKNTYLASFGE